MKIRKRWSVGTVHTILITEDGITLDCPHILLRYRVHVSRHWLIRSGRIDKGCPILRQYGCSIVWSRFSLPARWMNRWITARPQSQNRMEHRPFAKSSGIAIYITLSLHAQQPCPGLGGSLFLFWSRYPLDRSSLDCRSELVGFIVGEMKCLRGSRLDGSFARFDSRTTPDSVDGYPKRGRRALDWVLEVVEARLSVGASLGEDMEEW